MPQFWESYHKQKLEKEYKKIRLSDSKIKKIASNIAKDDYLIFDICWILKIFTPSICFSILKLKFFNFEVYIYVYNNWRMFSDFIKNATVLAGQNLKKNNLDQQKWDCFGKKRVKFGCSII